MDRLQLIMGGSRSGKSRYAQRAAEMYPAPRVFIATCQICDREMEERVRKHRDARSPADWITIEEPFNLTGALCGARESAVILIDCLTLWINNRLYEAQKNQKIIMAEEITAECHQVLDTCRSLSGTVIFVSGEVGMGIIPDNPLARLYQDCVGTCNQMIAAAADRVTLLHCGLPLTLKG